MRRFKILALGLFAIATGAVAQPNSPPSHHNRAGPHFFTEPSEAVRAEIAFARAAREKGTGKALLASAAPGAEMFVPQRVPAVAWLKRRPPLPTADLWAPHEVWIACDGTAALVDGVWRAGAQHGRFSAIWQRQKKGDYRWLLRDSDAVPGPADAAADSDTIAAHVADCPRGPSGQADRAKIAAWLARPFAGGAPATANKGSSTDQTLHWETTEAAGGAHNLSVSMWKDGHMADVHISQVAAAAR